MVEARENLEIGIRNTSCHVQAHFNTINYGFLMKTPEGRKPTGLTVKGKRKRTLVQESSA